MAEPGDGRRRAPGAAPQPPEPRRQVAFRLGLSAESRAAALLLAKGYRIAARRWRSPLGEVDIVARRRRTLAFVEVKARETFDDAAWSVTPRQRARIIAAAEAWLGLNPADAQCFIRFDVVLVAPRRLPQHIENAFDASL
ncbi:MAG TPA: YraN family protein [Xanthobacteraceae bacterium]|jgi:putative endonuclease